MNQLFFLVFKSFEIGIGLLAFWWSYFIFIHEIISQTNVDASVNFTNDNENPDVTIRIHNSNRQIEVSSFLFFENI